VPIEAILSQTFAPLNVVVLLRQFDSAFDNCLDLTALPQLGLPDQLFLSFSDRPGLMTKRESASCSGRTLEQDKLSGMWGRHWLGFD